MDTRLQNRTGEAQAGGYSTAQMHLLRGMARFSVCRDSNDLLQRVAEELQETFAARSTIALLRRPTANPDAGSTPPRISYREAGSESNPFRYHVGAIFRASQQQPRPPDYRWQQSLLRDGAPPGNVYTADISVANEPAGVVAMLLQPGQSLTDADLDILAAYAENLSMAISALQITSYTERRLEELKILYEISAIMAGASLNLDLLLRQTMTLASRVLRASAATLMLLDSKTNELVFEIPMGDRGDMLRQFRQPIGEGISGWVAATGEPLLVNNVAANPQWSSQADSASGFVTNSVLCVPLLVMGRTIGVLEALNKLDDQGRNTDFTSEDQTLLSTIGNQAAAAIENAQLYQSLLEERDRIILTEEEVRRQLNRDLHDGPAQGLASIVMRLDYIKKLLELKPDEVLAELNGLQELARKTNKEVRTMLSQLRPILLETQGLVAALQSYFEGLEKEGSIAYHLLVEPSVTTALLGSTAESAIFIIIQEAVNNIKKHAHASNVWLSLKQAPVPVNQRNVKPNAVTTPLSGTSILVTPGIVLTLRDDGRGFNVDEVMNNYAGRGSYGLLNMRERAQLLGGNVRFDSRPGLGTTVMIQVPFPSNQRDESR